MWCLRSPCPSDEDYASLVRDEGAVSFARVYYTSSSARPALPEKLEIRVKVYSIHIFELKTYFQDCQFCKEIMNEIARIQRYLKLENRD